MNRSLVNTPVLICFIVIISLSGAIARSAEEKTDPSRLTIDRIFDPNDLKAKKLGPFQWFDDNSGFTMLEDNDKFKSGKDIVRYDPATNQSEVLIPCAKLVPEGKTKAFEFLLLKQLLLIYCQ